MASVPPDRPDRIDPRTPPNVRPPVREPAPSEPPETEPLAPDVDDPGQCPEETPCPD